MALARTLRILHVSNFGYKPKGVFLHGAARKLSTGWARAGHEVCDFSDRDAARLAGPFGHRKWGILPANRLLLALARDFRPDVVAFGHADVIRPRTAEKIRAHLPEARILQWTVDGLFHPDTLARTRAKLAFVDATFASTGGEYLKPFTEGGRIAGFLPNPAERSIDRLRNFEKSAAELPHDVFLACHMGTSPRIHCGIARRPDDLGVMMKAAVADLNPSFHGILGKPHVFGPDYEKALSLSRLGLNFSHRNDIPLYSSDRLSHLAGNGLVVLIDRATRYGTLFGEDEFAFYSSEEELFETIARLKRDDGKRRAMAEAGWRRYHALFDAKLVAQYMLDALFGEHDPSRYEWPTLV